jgi:hypothetical protein
MKAQPNAEVFLETAPNFKLLLITDFDIHQLSYFINIFYFFEVEGGGAGEDGAFIAEGPRM